MDKVKEIAESTELAETLRDIELGVLTEGFTLSQAIRLGCNVTEKAENWGSGDMACALSAANLARKAAGY